MHKRHVRTRAKHERAAVLARRPAVPPPPCAAQSSPEHLSSRLPSRGSLLNIPARVLVLLSFTFYSVHVLYKQCYIQPSTDANESSRHVTSTPGSISRQVEPGIRVDRLQELFPQHLRGLVARQLRRSNVSSSDPRNGRFHRTRTYLQQVDARTRRRQAGLVPRGVPYREVRIELLESTVRTPRQELRVQQQEREISLQQRRPTAARHEA